MSSQRKSLIIYDDPVREKPYTEEEKRFIKEWAEKLGNKDYFLKNTHLSVSVNWKEIVKI